MNFRFIKHIPVRKIYFSSTNYKMSLTPIDENGNLFKNYIADCGMNEYMLTIDNRKENV